MAACIISTSQQASPNVFHIKKPVPCPLDHVERLAVAPRGSPRHSDLLIVSGRVCSKMAPVLRKIYDQMPEPPLRHLDGLVRERGGGYYHHSYLPTTTRAAISRSVIMGQAGADPLLRPTTSRLRSIVLAGYSLRTMVP